jgi:hypothetical protein
LLFSLRNNSRRLKNFREPVDVAFGAVMRTGVVMGNVVVMDRVKDS